MKKFDFFPFCHANPPGTSQLPVIYDHLGSGQDNKKNASIFYLVIKIKLFFLQIRNMYTSSKIWYIKVCPIIIKKWFRVHFWSEKSSPLHLRCYFFINFLISNDKIIIFTTYPLYTSIFHVAWIILTKAMMGGATTPLDICPVQTLLGCGQEKWGLDRTTICIYVCKK